MPETEPQAEQSALDTYTIGDRSLRDWHRFLTTDKDGTYFGDQYSVPASRYGRTAADCAWYALAIECVYVDANGEPDDLEASLDYSMGLCVNDNDSVMQLLREHTHAIPIEVLEHLELEEPDDEPDDDAVELMTDATYDSPRDAALHLMCLGAWACGSSGAPGHMLGSTWWMSNSEAERQEIEDTFNQGFEKIGLTDTRLLVGHWLISQVGVYVDVMPFNSEDAVRAGHGRIDVLYDRMEN